MKLPKCIPTLAAIVGLFALLWTVGMASYYVCYWHNTYWHIQSRALDTALMAVFMMLAVAYTLGGMIALVIGAERLGRYT
jgi:small neutral amino acid transporter SnatA (MarC family)